LEEQAAQPPDHGKNAVPVASVADPAASGGGRARTNLTLIGLGVVAVLAAAVVITWLLSSRGSAAPPVNNPASPTESAPSGNLVIPAPTSTKSGPDPDPTATSEPTDAAEMVDSRGVPMILIPAGDFIAGSDSGYENERPVHKVYLDDFYIDKYEVTNALFKACVDEGECQPPERTSSSTRASYFGNPEFDSYPVIFVSWENARDYCQWRGLDLPTEAQWEKAARGTDGRVYPWGDDIDPAYVNFNEYVGDTTEVGSYEGGKSPYGVHDMAGNAWEWVADWYSETYYLDTYDLNAPLSNPAGPRAGEYKVLRGGSWHDDATIVTTSNRGWNQLEYFYNTDFGFRCASKGTP
jgi:formylglycine-generating enzyme required for sulfatase activity